MTYLIDTQILIWFQANSKDLKPPIRNLLLDVQNEIFVSSISLYEIAIKQKINKLPEFPASIADILTVASQDGFQILPVYPYHVVSYDDIPLMADHRDPFDRLILATALSENLPIISSDKNFRLYKPKIQLIEA